MEGPTQGFKGSRGFQGEKEGAGGGVAGPFETHQVLEGGSCSLRVVGLTIAAQAAAHASIPRPTEATGRSARLTLS
jgi:hypothetical protein